jgi:hypothetical protein
LEKGVKTPQRGEIIKTSLPLRITKSRDGDSSPPAKDAVSSQLWYHPGHDGRKYDQATMKMAIMHLSAWPEPSAFSSFSRYYCTVLIVAYDSECNLFDLVAF